MGELIRLWMAYGHLYPNKFSYGIYMVLQYYLLQLKQESHIKMNPSYLYVCGTGKEFKQCAKLTLLFVIIILLFIQPLSRGVTRKQQL